MPRPKIEKHMRKNPTSFGLDDEYLAIVDTLALTEGWTRSRALRQIIQEWNAEEERSRGIRRIKKVS